MAAHMLAQAPSLQLQKYNFGLLARQAPSGRRRLRYMALAHLNEGKHRRGSACLARYAPRVTRWMKWFAEEGADRLAGIPHYWSTQTLAPAQEEAVPPSIAAATAQPRRWPCTRRSVQQNG
jgi:hypothetical protein